MIDDQPIFFIVIFLDLVGLILISILFWVSPKIPSQDQPKKSTKSKNIDSELWNNLTSNCCGNSPKIQEFIYYLFVSKTYREQSGKQVEFDEVW